MNSEQLLIDKWRDLTSLQQQEVLDFVEFIAQKSLSKNSSPQKEPKVNHSSISEFSSNSVSRISKIEQTAIEGDRTPSLAVKKWLDWSSNNSSDSPSLSDEALRRDSIYD